MKFKKKQPATRNLRYWLILISFIISYFMGVAAFELISPVSMVHRGLIFGLGFGLATMIVIFLFYCLFPNCFSYSICKFNENS